MQIEFLTSKEKFLKLYAWVKDNIYDLLVLDCKTKREFDESELYQAEVGYSKKICFTTREFAPLIKWYQNFRLLTRERTLMGAFFR